MIKNPSTFQLTLLGYSADFSYGLTAEEDILTLHFEGSESKTPQMLKFRFRQRARESIICDQLGLRPGISKSQRLGTAKMADVRGCFRKYILLCDNPSFVKNVTCIKCKESFSFILCKKTSWDAIVLAQKEKDLVRSKKKSHDDVLTRIAGKKQVRSSRVLNPQEYKVNRNLL